MAVHRGVGALFDGGTYRTRGLNERRTFRDLYRDSVRRSGIFGAVLFRFAMRRSLGADAKDPYFMGLIWSERRDSNSGPPVPQTDAPRASYLDFIGTTCISRPHFGGGLRWFRSRVLRSHTDLCRFDRLFRTLS